MVAGVILTLDSPVMSLTKVTPRGDAAGDRSKVVDEISSSQKNWRS